MKVGIIGPGRVGTALGQAFNNAGYQIVGISSREQQHARECMKVTQCNYWSADPREITKIADLVLITVPDSTIESVAHQIEPVLKPETILVHTSGTLPSSILPSKRRLSMHPMASFAGCKLPQGIYFGIEGDIELGKKLVKSIGSIPIVIPAAAKPLYHAALNFGAAYLLTILNKGYELLKTCEIRNAEEVILSLARTTLENAKECGISKSFTGPIQRRDTKVVEMELKAIKKKAPQVADCYSFLTKETEKILKDVARN